MSRAARHANGARRDAGAARRRHLPRLPARRRRSSDEHRHGEREDARPAGNTHEVAQAIAPVTRVVDPGLVRVQEWRPAAAAADNRRSSFWCAVSRKR
jgi:hypothetical protein